MCGIVGFVDNKLNYDINAAASLMGEAIFHRGPDDLGVWHDSELGVNLIHRRLSILDLSPTGRQPMLSASGRYVVVFNGEIYNYKQLKAHLEQNARVSNYRGHSDTEVMLMLIETYGIAEALKMLEGMFAFAIWDRKEQTLTLARDRMGEKPLYWGYSNGIFVFASELKAIPKHPNIKLEINRDAIGQLMMHNCIPAPLSIFEGIFKLLPGHFLTLTYHNIVHQQEVSSKPYWQLGEHLDCSFTGDIGQAVSDLDLLLQDVIANQVVADVPVGCFLSGGVDSSTVAAIMQHVSSKKIQTFSIGFDDAGYNEAEFARAVAKHIGSDHNDLYVSHNDLLNVVNDLPNIYDEPFSDSSQIPTYLVSKLAKQKVTVALSGDGGDELFAGYNRYVMANKLYRTIGIMPLWLRGVLSKLLMLSPNLLTTVISCLRLPVTNVADKIFRLESLLQARNVKQLYSSLITHWDNPADLVLGCKLNKSLWDKTCNFDKNPILSMQYLDSTGYLPDDILVKVDRAAMANSLETRAPLLNHRVVEFAYSLPQKYKIQGGISKSVLRQVLYKYVPQNLIERPKVGFAVPIHKWLREELKDWAIELLRPDKLDAAGYINSKLVNDKLNQHLSGGANYGHHLWDVLMFQQWFEHLGSTI